MTATTCTEQLALPAGQSRLHWLPAGTIVVMLDGRLMLEPPPRWLAGDLVRLRHTVAAGHAHTLETSGWWSLHADASAGIHLRLVAPVDAAPAGRTARPAPAAGCWPPCCRAAPHAAEAPGLRLAAGPGRRLGRIVAGLAPQRSAFEIARVFLADGTFARDRRHHRTLAPLPPSGCGICGRAGAGFGREGFRSGMAISSQRSGLLAAVLVLAEPLLVLR